MSLRQAASRPTRGFWSSSEAGTCVATPLASARTGEAGALLLASMGRWTIKHDNEPTGLLYETKEAANHTSEQLRSTARAPSARA